MKRSSTELSPRERELFKFIEHYQLKNGGSPTVREMRKYMNLQSDGFVVHMMEALKRKKFIKKTDRARGIKALPSVQEKLKGELIRLPVLEYVPAGGPVLTGEFIEDWVSVDPAAVRNNRESFCLRVKGESMKNAGILEGDYALVFPRGEPKPNDIIVALINNENTVRRFMKDKEGKPYLKAENPAFRDIRLEDGDIWYIQGVVLGLFRRYS